MKLSQHSTDTATVKIGAANNSPSQPKRRMAIKAAVVAASTATLSAPAVVIAQTTSLRFQSAWPAKAIFQEFAVETCRKIEINTGKRVQIQMLSSGAVVPPFQIPDAVSKGTLDGGHTLPVFGFGRNTAFGLYGAGPNFGMDSNQLLGWYEHGGGKALYEELLATAKLDIVSFMHGSVITEPFGWFRKEVKGPNDLKGLKYRTAGLAVDMMKELGAAPVQMAPTDTLPALERGVIDAAEYANPTDDRIVGFPDVAKNYYLQSYHMANTLFELLFNKDKFNAFPAEIKEGIRTAILASNSEIAWKSMDRYSTDLLEMQSKDGVKLVKTPDSVLLAQLDAWNKVIKNRSAENALFAKTIESQKAWAKKVVWMSEMMTADAQVAYRKFFA